MKNLVNRFVRIICMFIFICSCLQANSQTESAASSFNLFISNEQITEGRILEFDLFLLNVDKSIPFELATVQAGILINPEIYNQGTIQASIIKGSSELLELQQPYSILFSQSTNILKLAGRIVRPVSKEDHPATRGSIISSEYPGTRICRIRLTNTNDFAKVPANLNFCFDRNPYPTMVAKYIKGINTLIPCNSSNCFSKVKQ
jgi:hypothetical protein